MSNVKLTANEIQALKICLNYNEREGQLSDNFSNGGPKEFADALFKGNLQAAGGLISSLEKKGMGNMEPAEKIHESIFWISDDGVNTIFDIIESE